MVVSSPVAIEDVRESGGGLTRSRKRRHGRRTSESLSVSAPPARSLFPGGQLSEGQLFILSWLSDHGNNLACDSRLAAY